MRDTNLFALLCRVLDPRSSSVLLDTRGADGSAEPQTFETGMGMVPEALDLCVRLMTVQEMATVTSTSTYAYDGRSDKPEVLVRRSGLPACQDYLCCHTRCDLTHAVLHGRAWQTEQTCCSRLTSSGLISNLPWWTWKPRSGSRELGR